VNKLLPPKCPKIPKTLVEHGVSREDPYFWLREKENPKVKEYVEAENTYYSGVMAGLADLKKNYFERLKARLEPEAIEVPYRMGAYRYGSRIEKGSEYTLYFRNPISAAGGVGAEEVTLDLNEFAKKHKFVDLGSYVPSDAHDLLAYSLDTEGDEIYRLVFKALGTRTSAPTETIDSVDGNVVFSANGANLFYVKLNDQHRPFQLWAHALGTSATTDRLLYEEADPRYFLSLGKSSDGEWIILNSANADSTEIWLAPRAGNIDALRCFSTRKPKHEYELDAQGDRFLVLSNHEELNFSLYEVPTQGDFPAVEKWSRIFPGDARVDLRDLAIFKSHFALLYADAGVIGVRIFTGHDNSKSFEIPFPEQIRNVVFLNNEEYTNDRVRVSYASPVTPPETVEYGLADGARTLLHARVVPGFKKEDYSVERIEVTAPDGVKVPVSLMYRTADRGKALPTLLYGYGAYGMITATGFSSLRATLVDSGFLYAIAHVRGSGDLGQRWYHDGKLLKKKNTFADFQAAALELVSLKRSLPGEITIHGGSAGGMLVGATLNLDRSLYRGVVAEVPFVDVLNTMFDADLPLTPTEWDEWGDPRKLEYFTAMSAYSPYDRLEKGEYPFMFINGGWNDPRVTYWEPAKYVARLRDLRTDKRLTVMHIEMGAGHFGVTGRIAELEKPAEMLAFVHAIHLQPELLGN
jgi:oligopeptidase B